MAVVLIVTSVATIQLLAGGTLIGQDSATQAYPWYGYLGQQLRNLEIPGWNPFQFAGAPFAADPQSGWTYLPAMLIFGLLPLSLAVPVFLWVHLALAGAGVYLLTRALGMPVPAAVVAAIAYQLTGPVYGRSICCPAAMEVAVWTPWALAGAELAIRSGSVRGRVGGWALAGFALSQALAIWLGQGSYYLLLALAVFIAYRTLLSPRTGESVLTRVRAAALHGVAIVTIGFGLGAVGILPRLDYIARSNLANGEYAGIGSWAGRISGVTGDAVFERLLTPTLYYPGTTTMALALVGLMLARDRYATPYFGVLGLAAAILASPMPTPLHHLLYALLPRFEVLHQHWPERVSLVAYVAPAVLAGAAVAVVIEQPKPILRHVPAALAPIATVGILSIVVSGVPRAAFIATGAALGLLFLLIAAPGPALRRAVPLLLTLVIVADLSAANRATALNAPYGGFHRVEMDAYYESTGAAGFLKSRIAQEPARFFGFGPEMRTVQDGQTVFYRQDFAAPVTRDLLVNNRAMLYELHDVQGYNPVQVERYVELITALNGQPQDYHDANIFPSGIDSPLLNLLNVRYVVIPADDHGLPDDQRRAEQFATVYVDDDVRVVENLYALPRAWVVHTVRQVAPGEALALLASGVVDPRQTALVEQAPPVLEPPATGADQVVILDHHPDRIEAQVTTGAAGLVVFSEIFDPGWHAYVDGKPAPVFLVDHVLRAVSVGAGTHHVEWRYQTPMLLLGGAITGITVAILAGTALILAGRVRPRRTSVGVR